MRKRAPILSQTRHEHPRPRSLALLVQSTTFLAACSSRVPARVVSVKAQQVEIATAGTDGAATVVFEAGLGDDWTHWDLVARARRSRAAFHPNVQA
jgi:hypothetical protein